MRCYACSQENCAFSPCSCDCHKFIEKEDFVIPDTVKCATHPKYEVKRKPTSECESCWKVWQHKLETKSWADMTVRERIIEDLQLDKHRVRTASQVAKYTEKKLSTVSSELHSLFKEGLVLRVAGFGRNGGYGYLMNPNRKDDCLRLIGKVPHGISIYNTNP